jgi:hypothetical protein
MFPKRRCGFISAGFLDVYALVGRNLPRATRSPLCAHYALSVPRGTRHQEGDRVGRRGLRTLLNVSQAELRVHFVWFVDVKAQSPAGKTPVLMDPSAPRVLFHVEQNNLDQSVPRGTPPTLPRNFLFHVEQISSVFH